GRVDLAERPGLFVRNLPQQLVTILTVERRLERQKPIEGCAQRVEVCAVIDAGGLGPRLFRAHVAQRAHEISGNGQPGLTLAAVSQAEVRDPQADAGSFRSVSPVSDARTSLDDQVG